MSSYTPKWLDVGLPTVDRPFGIALWPIFSKVFEMIKGYEPQDFRFIEGQTAMSTKTESLGGIALYYAIIFVGREFMRNRPALKLSTLFKIHNFYLTFISGALLLLFMEQIIPTLIRNGLFYVLCHQNGGWTNELVILHYLNYLTKYLEFIDTFFLFLRKKPLTFLHTYHHGATALLVYSQILGKTATSWVPVVLNLTVHVVMYWYYFQAARGIRITWKKWITILQITQFVLDLACVYFVTYTYFTSTYFPWLPNMGTCSGEEFAAFSANMILTSYLVLFIMFYLSTYKKPAPKKGGRTRSVSALVDMAREPLPSASDAKKAISNTYEETVASAQQATAAATGADANGSVNGSARSTRSRKA